MSELHDDTPNERGWYWIMAFGDRWFMAFLDTSKTPIELRVMSNNTERKFDGEFFLDENDQWLDRDNLRSIENPLAWYGPLQHPERL